MKDIKSTDILSCENLVQSWMFVEGKILKYTLRESIALLNHNVECDYMNSRIWEWSRCENKGRGVQMPKKVRRYMSEIVLPHTLRSFGFKEPTLSRIDFTKLSEMLN